MEKNELRKILFENERNIKRIDQIRDTYYTTSAVRFDKDYIQNNKVNNETENKVISFLMDKEYQELDKKVKAVECMCKNLTPRQRLVYKRYFVDFQTTKEIERLEFYSVSTIQREINNILDKLKQELV